MEDHPGTGVCMVSSMRMFKCDCRYASGHSHRDCANSCDQWKLRTPCRMFCSRWDDHYSNQCSLVHNRLGFCNG